jgi:hypothetical protein
MQRERYRVRHGGLIPAASRRPPASGRPSGNAGAGISELPGDQLRPRRLLSKKAAADADMICRLFM